ncbi:xylose isomerase-like protein [Flammula alnicola]|nr:xylose isomerase-like protein [Flammula alnicola]
MVKTRQSTRAATHGVSDEQPSAKRMKPSHDSASRSVPSGNKAILSDNDDDLEEGPSKRRRQTKGKEKAKGLEVDPTTFLQRVDSPWMVGAHVSAAGGVENAVVNAVSIGANAFALFVKSQRKWTSPPLTNDSITEFKKRMQEHKYTSKMVLPHGSYLINLGNPDKDKREKSYVCFLDDLKRCQALGLELYNFHPGSTVGETSTDTSLALIAECINRAHKETEGVTAVLENMAGARNIIGSDFSHLAGIIERVEDKTRVGVCIDTCHAFTAGYDIRTKEGWDKTMKEFDEKIGLKYLCGMHLNDSKAEFNSKKDRHENVGLGHLGLQTFRHILSDPRTQGIPLILETPTFEQAKEVWGTEISVLQRISGCADRQLDPQAGDLEPGGVGNRVELDRLRGKTELDFDALVQQVKSASKEAEKNHGGSKAKTKKASKGKDRGVKRKRKGSKREVEDDDDESEYE